MKPATLTLLTMMSLLTTSCGGTSGGLSGRATQTLEPAAKAADTGSGSLPLVSLRDVGEAYTTLEKTTKNMEIRKLIRQRKVVLASIQDAPPLDTIKKIEALLTDSPRDPGNAELYYQLAYTHQKILQSNKALQALTRLTDDFPLSPLWREAQFRRAELLFTQSQYSYAATAYRSLVSGNPTQPYYKEALYKLGWTHLKMGSLGPMQECFYDLLDILPLGEDIRTLAETDQAMAKDVLRALTIAHVDTRGAAGIASYWDNRKTQPVYLFQVYESLAEMYSQQQRHTEAAETFAEVARRLPQHTRAATSLLRAAESYELAGHTLKAQSVRAELLKRYDVASDTRATTTVAQHEKNTAVLQDAEYQAARYYHGLGQQTGKKDNFTLAIRGYQEFLTKYPQSELIAEVQFLEAEAHYEMGNYPAAIAAYYKAAYVLPKHKNSAEAAYAELLTWQKREDISAEARSTGFDESMERFINQYPQDDRWPAVSQKKAEQQFTRNDHKGALATARSIQRAMEQNGKAVAPGVMSLIAQCEYELGQFGAAEQAARLVAATVTAAGQQAEQNPQLGTMIYRQGEMAYQRERWQEAAGHFARVPATTEYYPLGQYYGGNAYYLARDFKQAQPMLHTYITRYPAHEFTLDARTKLAEIYESLGQWGEAAKQLEILAPTAKTQTQHQAWLLRATQHYTKAGMAREGAQVDEKITIWFSKPLDMILEARLRLAAWYQSQGDSHRQRAQLEEIVKKRPYAQGNSALARIVARAAIVLAETDGRECRRIALKLPLDTTLKRKKALLQSAVFYYNLATEMDPDTYASTASYHSAQLYQEFAQALIDSERPAKLSREELEVYLVMLEEQAYPIEEKAISLYEIHLKQSASNSSDPWREKSRQALKKLRPAQPNP